MPKVSVLIPVYNGEAEIARALDSILAQTTRDFEILVLDDGSTDRTAEVVARYSQVTLIRQTNAGIGASRQRLLEATQGEWVGFCDHDDTWHPTKLERQLGAATPETVLVHAHFDAGGTSRTWTPAPDALPLDHLLPDNRIHTSSALLRRSAALAAGGFPVDSSRAEDYAAWFRLAGQGSFTLLPEVLTVKHARPGSASAPDSAWYAAERAVLQEEFLSVLSDRFGYVSPAQRDRFRRLALRKLAIAGSLEAECLDREGRRREARLRHLEAIRSNPTSPGAWRRMLRHLLP